MGFFKTIKNNLPARNKHAKQILENQRLIMGAICDPNGLGKLHLLLNMAHIPQHYHYVFHQMFILNDPASTNPPVCIDGGGHVGAFADIALHCGAIVHIFEPNIHLFAFLQRKYKDNPRAILHRFALSNQNYKTQFLLDEKGIVSDGNSIVPGVRQTQESYEVEVIALQDFIQTQILPKHERIAFLKLDVEGAEFDIMESILNEKLYEKIDFIACETHARFFQDGSQKLKRLEDKINSLKLQNIFLDWA